MNSPSRCLPSAQQPVCPRLINPCNTTTHLRHPTTINIPSSSTTTTTTTTITQLLTPQVKGQGDGSASERTRTSVTAGLKKKLKDQMGDFSGLRNRIQDEYREVVERRVYTVTGEAHAACVSGVGWGKGREGGRHSDLQLLSHTLLAC